MNRSKTMLLRKFPEDSVGRAKAIRRLLLFCAVSVLAAMGTAGATTLRRPISPAQPMILVHVDAWNAADPQKVIDLIPEDIRPYAVITISLSINHSGAKSDGTCNWLLVDDGYETAKSWLRTAAENRMWAMVQPSSGGYSHLPDYDTTVDLDTTVYGEFFREYPNFLGINYAEQFWGFDDNCSPTWVERVNHWQNLLKLCDKYGGYVDVSFTGGYYGASLNPVAMVKRNPGFAAALKKYSRNFIIEEKYTMAYGFHDIESTSMGMWLSGYAGHYGIRFDQCGWVSYASEDFPVSAGAAPFLEHIALTGETVVDGPELIWQQCVKSLSNGTTTDGYAIRKWDLFPQYRNITLDIFRKILDGTVRILDRKEVVARSKLVVVDDATSGTDQAKYSSPQTLFDSLYLMTGDGTYLNNKSWFKKSGRYPAVPAVYQLVDDTAKAFQVQVNSSTYSTRWSTAAAKRAEFDGLFGQEYTGDIYAGRSENLWVTYNPYKSGQAASGTIPFKYNTCDSLKLGYQQYSVGLVKEYSGKLALYMSNYDNSDSTLKTDTVRIYGSSSQPTYTYADRGSHQASTLSAGWSGGVFTLTVKHCGPLDVTVNASGTATGRLGTYTAASLVEPSEPDDYQGPRQYEAEHFDVKSVSSNVTGGHGSGITKYTGMGFLKFGTSSSASARDTVAVLKTGSHKLYTRYSSGSGKVTTVDLYVNGTKVATPAFAKTASDSDWQVDSQTVTLNAGTNVVMFKANATGSYGVILDNIVISGDSVSTTSVRGVSPSVVSGSGPVTYRVYDYSGRKIGTVAGTEGQDLSTVVDHLSVRPGVYFVRYVSSQGMVARRIVAGAK
jgi:hypothetical protein